MRVVRAIDLAAGRAAAALTAVYRFVYSSRMPPVCLYAPSCSEYAALAWRRFGLAGGMHLVVSRLRRCEGGTWRGVDLPPEIH
jgi:putative component of membrane protein insertase Oxa1/YidC/SpoIIIJ protein YidD